jgi:hypothetical protein
MDEIFKALGIVNSLDVNVKEHIDLDWTAMETERAKVYASIAATKATLELAAATESQNRK